MNDIDEPAFKQFVTSMVRHSLSNESRRQLSRIFRRFPTVGPSIRPARAIVARRVLIRSLNIPRHFRPFRLFRPRRFRRLPFFSFQFDDLRRHKFGTHLAIIASAGKPNAEDLDPRHPELPLLSD
jgi:hypothetical protein